MTLMESALIGIFALVAAVSLAEVAATLTRRPWLAERCWGAVLVGVGALYTLLGREVGGSHDLAALGLLAIWAVLYGVDVGRRGGLPPSAEMPPTRRIARSVGELFLASAPLLLICTEAYDPAWTWIEAAAFVLFAGGAGYVVWVRRFTASPVPGYVAAYAALYLLALATPSGWLTLFAVVAVSYRVERTLGRPRVGIPTRTSDHGLSPTPGGLSRPIP